MSQLQANHSSHITLRPYTPEDCEEISLLFYETVHTVNAKDYSRQQLDVWATGSIDLAAWNKSFLAHTSFVAVDGETIAGFGDIDSSGYLDRLYVHKDYQGIGIATALCEKLEASVESTTVTTHASITARPFFEHRGYVVKKEQQVERQGILLTNYVMEKQQKNTTSQRILSNSL